MRFLVEGLSGDSSSPPPQLDGDGDGAREFAIEGGMTVMDGAISGIGVGLGGRRLEELSEARRGGCVNSIDASQK